MVAQYKLGPRNLIRWCLLLTLFIGTSALANPSADWQQEPDRFGDASWETLGTETGVALARKRIGGNGLFAVRGETVIKAPMNKVANIIYNKSQ